MATWFGAGSATGDRVRAAMRPPDGDWSPPATLSGDGAYHPSLAVAASGSAVVAWEQLDPATEGFFIEAAVRKGGVWSSGAPLPKGTELHGAYFPRVAVNSTGDAVAVWQQCYSTDYEACFTGQGNYLVRASQRSAGGSWSAPMTLSDETEDAIKLSPAVNAAGDLAVIWEDRKAAVINVALRRAGASSWNAQQLSATGVASGSAELGLAADGTGIAVWDSFVEGNYRAATSLLAAGSSTWSAPGFISQPGVNAFQPRLALAPSGEAVAVWETIGGNLVQGAIRTGGTWGPARNLSGEAAAEPHPSVAINPAGAMLAVWQGGPGAGSSIQGNHRPAGGDWLGAMSVPSSAGTEPAVAIDPQGDGATVWRDPSASIQAALFEDAGTGLPGNPPTGSGAGGATAASGSNGETTAPEPKSQPGTATLAGVAKVRNGKVLLRLRCGSPRPCAGFVKLVWHGKILGKATFQVPAQGSRTISIALRPSAKTALSTAGPDPITISAVGFSVKPRKLMLKQ